MIIWGIFWGAMLGMLMPGHDGGGMFLGGFFGFFAGLTLRWAVRSAIADARQAAPAPVEPARAAADWPVFQPEAAPAAQPMIRASASLAESKAPDATPATASASASQDASLAASPPAALTGMAQPADAGAAPGEPGEPGEGVRTGDIPALLRPAAAAQGTGAAAQTHEYKPAEPSPVDQALLAAKNWLMGGNTIVRAGLVILFIGLSFLARYAAVAGFFPVELRLGAIAAAALALLVVGFRKREAKPAFALALQGAGVAVMYLTVFAAFRLYTLMPALAAFGLMIVVCALSCALALLQNSRVLAVAAFAGGFAVPILLSTGQGSHVALFSYYTVLNLAILFIAWQRSWRVLNVTGFIATFGVATAWGVLKFSPEHYASTQWFLAGFLLIYLFTAILYARNTPTRLGNAVDSMLVFGTPLVAFGLQAGLTRNMELGVALSAVAFAALYLTTAMLLVRRALESYRLLIECFIAIGVGFATLAVPLALDVRWTSAVWALEGAGAFWVGMRQARWMPRAFGLLLQVVAALGFLGGVGNTVSAYPFANPAFLGAMLIALPAITLAWWLRRPLEHSGSAWARGYAEMEQGLSSPVYLYGFFFWCLAWLLEIGRRVPAGEQGMFPEAVFSNSVAQLLGLLALVMSAALSMWLGAKVRWPITAWPSRLSLFVMAIYLAAQWSDGHRVLHTPAWAVWPLVLLLHYWMLRQQDRLLDLAALERGGSVERGNSAEQGDSSERGRVSGVNHFLHAASALFITLLLADCLWSGIDSARLWSTSWAGVVLLISAIAVLMLLTLWAGKCNVLNERAAARWPLNPHAAAYYWAAALPLAALIFAGTLLAALNSSGRTAPLPYIPLLNPTDLTLALALGALLIWRRMLTSAAPPPEHAGWVTGPRALVALALVVFVAINSVWLRIAHHYFDVRWNAGALFASFVVQTGYAILWTLLAFGLMLLAHRRLQRALWLAGAGLLALVVLKLLVIDLSNAGGAERIIAFIAVGALMLVVGYFAPLPPKPAADAAGEINNKEAQP